MSAWAFACGRERESYRSCHQLQPKCAYRSHSGARDGIPETDVRSADRL